jgi:excisionase family DNA binding protein
MSPLKGHTGKGEPVEYLDLDEFLDRVGPHRVSRTFVGRLVRDGELEGFKFGRRWMIRSDALERLAARQEATRTRSP